MVLLITSLICLSLNQSIFAKSLYWGSTGSEVETLQEKLSRWGYYNGSIDGIFGTGTSKSVKKFQKKNGLNIDGIVGLGTKKALGMNVGKINISSNYSDTVKKTQEKLKRWGYYFGSIDGIYGAKTYDGVTKFQKKNGLSVDGKIGPQTRTALGLSEKTESTYIPTSRGISRNDDINILAMVIHGEARGEPYVGQVAVGAVVLNRVKHPSFPNSISGVIYQPLAFSAVDDGQMYLKPDESSYKAAQDALNGWDPTGNAIYYWNPVTATSKWIWTKTPTMKIGKHWFANN